MKRKTKENLIVLGLVLLIIVLWIVDSSIAAKNKIIIPRTTQYNVFSIPVDTTDVIWIMTHSRSSLIHKYSLGYSRPPRAKTEEEMAEITDFAKSLLGVRYAAAGKSPSTGFDCSGFVRYVFANCGYFLESASTAGQYQNSYILPEGEEKPGDIVFFTGTGNASSTAVSHVGIYLGNREMIHAATAGISITSIDTEYWSSHFLCFGRPYK